MTKDECVYLWIIKCVRIVDTCVVMLHLRVRIFQHFFQLWNLLNYILFYLFNFLIRWMSLWQFNSSVPVFQWLALWSPQDHNPFMTYRFTTNRFWNCVFNEWFLFKIYFGLICLIPHLLRLHWFSCFDIIKVGTLHTLIQNDVILGLVKYLNILIELRSPESFIKFNFFLSFEEHVSL